MFGWRTAKGRALLAGAVFMLLLATVVAMAVWRARDDEKRHSSLQRRSAVVFALDDARAQSYLAGAWAAFSPAADDPRPFHELYEQATKLAQADLDQAQVGLISLGAKEEVDALGELVNQREQFLGEMHTLWAVSLSVDRSARAQVAQEQLSHMWSISESVILGLDELAKGQQAKLIAERGAADRAADATLTFFIAFGLVALVGGTASIVIVILSVVRPLASLQASARAITSGDLQTRAKVSGPEEVASLARDFNEMVTARGLVEHALRERSRRDPMTGALNHGTIVDELRSLISSGGDGTLHTVAMVDVDGLKATNDAYGHQVGDAVLVAVAGALSRDGALVGRYGGDEFVAILPGANRQEAERYQAAVVEALASAGLTDPEMKAKVPVAVSIGLATYPTEAARVEDLIRLADSEMYAAKRMRPFGRVSLSTMDPLDADRAAKTLGEIVPLLTSPGELNDKLQLVAHRLAVGAGYDGVHFEVLRHLSELPAGQSAFAQAPDELVEAWNREQRKFEGHALPEIIQRTHRPIILDDVQNDQRLTDAAREILRAAGLRSALLVPMFWQDDLLGHLAVASKQEAAFGPRDVEFLMAVVTQVTAIVRMATLVEDLQSASHRLVQAQTETVVLLAASAEAHDHATGLHLENVRAITGALARELGYGEEEARELGLAAVLHDIGKVRVPDSLLSSAGTLADEEWELMKHHTSWGAEFLAGRPGFELAATIARSHHERWDGGGYPDGLAGEAIPESAAIVAVADSFDAMTSDRPYRAARSVAAAMRESMACSGKQFSPKVVQALVRLHKRKMLLRPHRYTPEEKAVA